LPPIHPKPPMRFPAKIAPTSLRYLLCALLTWITFIRPTQAAVLAGAEPKEWPANPAKHKVVIKREAVDKKQLAMIAVAEATQPSKLALQQAAGGAPLPAGEKVWWAKEQLGIRVPCAITADAITYYADLVGNYGKKALTRYSEPSSNLDYHAGIKFHQEFNLEGKAFKEVHVVTLKLSFSQHFAATATEGFSFEKQRVVVLDANGKVLHVAGDGLTEALIMAI
jgi:hypothetical protein